MIPRTFVEVRMLISCVVYQQGRKVADIDKEAISEYVARPDCLVWVALRDPTPEELDDMAEEFGLHPLAVEDARKGHQRPKIEEYDESTFFVMHTVELGGDAGASELVLGEVDVFVGPNYVLSVRHRTLRGFADVRARCEREPELLGHGAGYVLYALMDSIVDRYFPVLDSLSGELETIEEALFDESSTRRKIADLYALKRRLMVLKHAVSPLAEAVGKLHGGRVPHIFANLQNYFRDVYDHLTRIDAGIESIRDMLTTAISVNIALVSLGEGEVTKRLAAWGALITIPTLVAGIYGMNFRYMPELQWTGGYAFALVLMAGIDGVLYWRFRRAGWL
jgi:magnesium transporter